MLIAAVTAAATSCDTGKRDVEHSLGPAILVVDVNVGDGKPMPADGAIQIAFDRYLLPATVNRQSIVIVDGANQQLTPELAPIVLYDPVARTVTLAPPKQPWLTEGQPYKVILGIPEGNADTGGVRAIDRATLYPEQKRDFAFFVGPKANKPIEPTVSFCRDVLPIFYAKCATIPTCHITGERAAASLGLDTSVGVGATALNRVAQGANRGARSGLVTTSEPLFGVDMPLIDPGSPGNSWLMYKIEMARLPVTEGTSPIGCTNGLLEPATKLTFSPLATKAQRSADDLERTILSDYILGREMPFPVARPGGYADFALTFDEREKVRLWIQSLPKGSSVPECGGCGELPQAPSADAGAKDAADQ
ncbi:MAG TPA: hypothetical protein VLT33_13985 [Labilithrix sp.]|nr:hypothetical protein [Labilithrix sp.]